MAESDINEIIAGMTHRVVDKFNCMSDSEKREATAKSSHEMKILRQMHVERKET